MIIDKLRQIKQIIEDKGIEDPNPRIMIFCDMSGQWSTQRKNFDIKLNKHQL